MPLHLLALLDRAPRVRLRAIDGPIRFVRVGPQLVAAVEPRRTPAPVDERALRAHDLAVRRLCERAEAVLPARFGAPLADESALVAALGGRASALAAALERVRGREQLSLRVFRAPASRKKTSGGAGRRFLEDRREALRVPALDPLRAQLRRLVRAERVDPGRVPGVLATVHHLVDRGGAARYRALVEAALARGAAPPLDVRGPFPPYAFAEEDGA